jgi:hypothetical protein
MKIVSAQHGIHEVVGMLRVEGALVLERGISHLTKQVAKIFVLVSDFPLM